jgi:hypothetical protein
MSPIVRYTLARLGLFVLVALVVLAVPVRVDLMVKLAAAVLVTFVLAFFLLRRLRDEAATQIAEAVQRRAERKDRLRSALSGEDGTED